MEHEIRPLAPEDVVAFVRAEFMPFGIIPEDKDLAWACAMVEPERSFTVVDAGRIVATAGAYSFDLTLPGGVSLPVAGVTNVGVLPTHRRRGILRAMMRHQLDELHEAGEPIAVLTASESLLYGRYGYGMASTGQSFEVETAHSEFAEPLADAGRLDLLDSAGAAKVLPALHEQIRRRQPGDISRRSAYWDLYFADPEVLREGASRRFHVLHESSSGEPDGFLTYRITRAWPDRQAHNRLVIDDLMALDHTIEAALWRLALGVDLVGTVEAPLRAMDDPLRLRLMDPRRLKVTHVGDLLWCRLVDVAGGLAARRYATTDALVLDVVDDFCPWNTGAYRLETTAAGEASCHRVSATSVAPDLALGVTELGAAYLGGTRFTDLARAGRVDERVPGALARADALFAAERAPWLTTGF